METADGERERSAVTAPREGHPGRLNCRDGPDLLEVAVEALARDARRWFYRRQEHPGGLGKPRGTGDRYEQRVAEACARAAALSSRFRGELDDLLREDVEGFREIVVSAAQWRETTPALRPAQHRSGMAGHLADHLAAALVARNLEQMAGCRGDLVWNLLFHRVAGRVILPRLRVEVTEDRIRDCIAAMLASVGRFAYRDPTQAVAYLTAAYRMRNRPAASSLMSVTIREVTAALPECGHPSGTGAALFREAAVPAGARQHPRPGWQRLVQVLEFETALRMWILGLLKEDRRETWATIAALVLQPECAILSDDDLPPGASWAAVLDTFQAMARNSRSGSGAVSVAALRQFYCRTHHRLEAVPLPPVSHGTGR
jgi:hypothetical protein